MEKEPRKNKKEIVVTVFWLLFCEEEKKMNGKENELTAGNTRVQRNSVVIENTKGLG